jgi:hypothetical protein
MKEKMEFTDDQITKAIENLNYAARYKRLMDMFTRVDVSADNDFKTLFEEFYMLKRKKSTFRDKYFQYMQNKKNCAASLQFKEVLDYLFTIEHTVEASFASKLLHTINHAKFPTWDRWIGKNTGIIIPPTMAVKEKQKQKATEGYAELVQWFADYRQSENGKKMLAEFDKNFACFTGITDIKKIDLVLWQMR